jgi:alpha-D-ribose 1-methylphosphonate 5-triphosphate synthase subunit PhnI
MSVAIKGGEQAIANAIALLAEERRGNLEIAELSLAQIEQQFGLAVDRVMMEGSIYDRGLAALALKQAQGDAAEAVFLLRAYRTTLPRFAASRPVETAKIAMRRRISAIFKDLPGGQVLGSTYDYTHRLLDFALAAEGAAPPPPAEIDERPLAAGMPSAIAALEREGLIEPEIPERDGAPVFDLTREPASFPAGRDQRLQNLARGEEGFITGLAYSTTRGYGGTHPFVGELRQGEVTVEIVPEDLGFPIVIGEIMLTECQMVDQFTMAGDAPPRFTRGYGLAFGRCERKTLAMALLDRALRCAEYGEEPIYPAQDQEFVLSHSDGVEASGLVSHYKLPHYVDFQAQLQLVRKLRAERDAASPEAASREGAAA